jgi:hypothetical protein
VALLKETFELWSPIVVWGAECLVVDGAHRVEAARQLGRETISAVYFAGDLDGAFVESVRRNVTHGLPLTVTDRKRAAVRILGSHRDWSDRRIAAVCGLSGKTVARIRFETLPCEPDRQSPGPGEIRRIGLDGKARPARRGAVQDRVRQALHETPDATLRSIARRTGSSPETVRTVRARLAAEGCSSSSPGPVEAAIEPPQPSQVLAATPGFPQANVSRQSEEPPTSAAEWERDLALLTCGDEGEFARWFASNNLEDDWQRYLGVIPISRVYKVVDEARRRSAGWAAFASLLESRTR